MSKKEYYFVTAIVILGATLRIYNINLHSLWLDELSTWALTQKRPFIEMFKMHMDTDGNPPLFWILHYPLTFITPTYTEWGARSSALLYGILSIPTIYYAAKTNFNVRVAKLATIFISTSYLAIYFSQEARAFSLTILLCIITTHFWFRIWNGHKNIGNLIGYILSAAGLMYSHNYGLLYVVGQSILALVYIRRIGWKNVTLVGLGILVLYLPWLPILINQTKPQTFWMSAPQWIDIFSYNKYLFERSSFYGALGTILLVTTFAIAAEKLRQTKDRNQVIEVEKMIILLLFGVLPFGIAFWRSVTGYPILHNRYMVIALPSVIISVSVALDYIGRTIKRDFLVQAVAAIVVAVSAHNLLIRFRHYTVPQRDLNRETVQMAINWSKEKKVPVIVTHKWPETGRYYFHQLNVNAEIDSTFLPFTSIHEIYRLFARERRLEHFILWVYRPTPTAPEVSTVFHDYEVVNYQFFARANHLYELKRK